MCTLGATTYHRRKETLKVLTADVFLFYRLKTVFFKAASACLRFIFTGAPQVQQLTTQCCCELEGADGFFFSFKEHCSACVFQALLQHHRVYAKHTPAIAQGSV